MTRPVVLDTSVCLLPFTDGTDLADELQRLAGAVELVLPASVMEELRTMAQGGGARSRSAAGALRLLAHATMADTRLPGDDGVLEAARARNAIVATNDKALRTECRRSGLQVVGSREPGRLAWV